MDRAQIAKRLVALRGAKSRELVAQELNISIRALESYETGYRVPRDAVKVQIAKYYGVSVESLFFNEELHTM